MTNSLIRLEFGKVLENIAVRTSSNAGNRKVMALAPEWNPEAAEKRKLETIAAAELLASGIRIPAGGNDDLHEICNYLDDGAIVLDPPLLRTAGIILSDLDCFRDSADSYFREKGDLSVLEQYISRLPRLRELSDKLILITTSDGELSPEASKELSRLTRQVDRLKRKLSKRIERISSAFAGRNILRDIPPTLRDGRYVLPVISSRKGDIRGIVHDRSESGETIFIEPSELVEDGNDLRESSLDLDYEKRRILREITSEVREQLDDLKDCLDASSSLDAIFARASFHREYATVFPLKGKLSLVNLRHPLIPEEEIVKNSVVLPEDWSVLIVSGPNAGGKSVLLKAVGLAVVSSQSGIGSCADIESTLPFFDKIHVSIGDQQSIARHQSTYSARLIEQLEMLDAPGGSSLVLIDEPAAGTDPLTGAALAASVMEDLAKSGCRLIVTTHQGQLKSFAQGRAGFYNGCMNFQSDSLQPDYTFIAGVPGSSFTLEIARRMQFPESVLKRAQELSGDSFKLDRILEEITSTREKVKRELEDLEREREEAGKSLQKRETELDTARRNFIHQRNMIEEGYREIERSVNSRADSLLAELARTDRAEERRELRAEIREISKISQNYQKRPETEIVQGEIKQGDWVSVKGWSGSGRVEETGKEHASVILGNLRLRKPLSDLQKVTAPDDLPSSAGWSVPEQVETELDLRGMSSDETLSEIDRALDDGIIAGIPFITIIHGKGKGILMRAVVNMVRSDVRIASFRPGKPAEGGTGVTIVFLKTQEKRS